MQFARLSSLLLLVWCLLSVECRAGDDGQDDEEVCQVDGTGSAPQGCTAPPAAGAEAASDGIVSDVHKLCPLINGSATHGVLWTLRQLAKPIGFLQTLGAWPSGISHEHWADDYITVSYLLVVRFSLGLYKARDSSWVNIPTEMSDPEDVVAVERIFAPHWDVDGTPNFLWFEGIVPQFVMHYFYAPALTCFQSMLRRLSTHDGTMDGNFEDSLTDPMENTWESVLNKSTYNVKRDWVMAFYDIAKAWDGSPLWPKQMTNFMNYWKNDEFEDSLEHAIAFHLIGSHRVEAGAWTFQDLPGIETLELPFRLPLNAFSAFEVRDHFGKYGADMYFNAEGLPVLIETPTGEKVMRGDKAWQYWKFVWRSTLVTGITLVDHLHFTHFRSSSLLARMTRATAEPKSPMRRYLSIFTFGAIFVNLQAMHTLIGANHMLHRATPFKKFTALSEIVPNRKFGLMHDVVDNPGIRPLFNDTEWQMLHPKMKESPYFADGRLVAKAIAKMNEEVFKVIADELCDPKTGEYKKMFWNMKVEIYTETMQAGYPLHDGTYTDESSCAEMKDVMRHRLNAYIYIVSAWHKHVGFVGDYYADPHLATMSWKEGEPYGRPKQHIIMSIINVFTSTNQPLLKQDFTHLFKGMEPDVESDFVRIWRDFQRDLQSAEEEIERRNKKRAIFSDNLSPRVLEAAVSK